MAQKRYYNTRKKTSWDKIGQEPIKMPTLEKPFKFEDKSADKVFNDWAVKFQDDWYNSVASINANNSLTQYSEFLLNRLSYAECSHLSTDTIIHNAITKYTNEIMREGGWIEINDDIENGEEIIDKLEKRMKQTKLLDNVKKAIEVSLEYGNALFFVDIDSQDLSKPLVERKEVFQSKNIRNFKVVAPFGVGALEVDTANLINQDYMIPKKWYVQGAGTVHSSRLENLIIFKCPELIKPLYNFGGISLAQFMKNYVSTADSTRQSIADAALRFKTDTIKSDLVKINPQEAVARAKSINRQKNNYGTLLLTKDEEYVQTATALTGLEGISSHEMEYVAVSARMPSTKLFGLTPSGFNSTGDYELQTFYDEIMSIQNADIKPLIEKMLRYFALEMGLDIYPEYKFNELNKKDELKQAQIFETYLRAVGNAIGQGLFTHEQGINILKKEELLDDSFTYDESALENIDLTTLEPTQENE